MKYHFERMFNSGSIIVSLVPDQKYKFRMILDTGCSNTTIDSNALYISGYETKDKQGDVEIETANGIVSSEIFEVKQMDSLGIKKDNFSIQVYDFIGHGIFSNYDGLIGLDFTGKNDFCIDWVNNIITI